MIPLFRDLVMCCMQKQEPSDGWLVWYQPKCRRTNETLRARKDEGDYYQMNNTLPAYSHATSRRENDPHRAGIPENTFPS